MAARVTTVPLIKGALHVVLQLMPGGLLVTVPEPYFLTARVGKGFMSVKLAVTDLPPAMVTVQVFPELESQPILRWQRVGR